jgi:hypothetical protein
MLLVLVTLLASCAHDRPNNALGQAALPEPRRAQRSPPPPEWYWEPVDAHVRVAQRAVELPVSEDSLARVEGATRVWDELGAAGRERLGRDGLVAVASAEARLRMGEFYTDLRDQRVPYVLTLDALAYALHVGFERALVEVDDTLLAPGLDALLGKLDARLGKEQKGAGVELGEALGFARAMVAVAQGLSRGTRTSPRASAAPLSAELGEAVNLEIARVHGHAGTATSPVLGAPIDYARFAVPAGAAHPGSFQALAWLASAPLLFRAQSEVPGAVVGVATSRLHTRAAMVLARLSLGDVDPEIHALWSRLARVLAFVWGPADDLMPPELAEVGASIGVALEDPKHVANVVTVDRLRRRAARARPPLLFDGSGAPARAGAAMRLLGGHAAADSIVLSSLIGTSLGTTSTDPPPSIARDGARALPSALDLAAWLGAKEGRAAVHESGLDAFSGYDAALARAITTRPDDLAPARHASVNGSLLDVVMTWLAPQDGAPRALTSPAAQRAAIESALAAWTYARHDGQPLSRPPPRRLLRPPKDLEVKGAPLPVFVEQAPDVIARLVATVGQMKRGLVAVGGLPATSPAMISLAEVEDILRTALRISVRQANDEAVAAEDVSALASIPARLLRLEEESGAVVPVVAELVVDASGDRSLSSATGVIESAATIVRESGSGRLLLAVGAHVAHHELVEPRGKRSTDASHRERLRRAAGAPSFGRAASGPGRGVYTMAFRMVR